MVVEVFRHTAANVNFHIKTVTKEADSKTAPRAVFKRGCVKNMDAVFNADAPWRTYVKKLFCFYKRS